MAVTEDAFADVLAVDDPDVAPLVLPVEVFAVVLAIAGPDVVPLMLPVEVLAVVLANADPDVVPLMLLVVGKGGAIDEADSMCRPAQCPLR